MWKYLIFIGFSLSLGAGTCLAQRNTVTKQDYKRAEHFLPAYTDSMVHHAISGAIWQNNSQLIYRDAVEKGIRFMIANPLTREKRAAFDQKKLAHALSKMKGKSYDTKHLPLRDVHLMDNGKKLEFSLHRTKYSCDLGSSYSCQYLVSNKEVLSPDGKKAVFIKDYNLWMRNLQTGKLTQLTYNGKKNYGYGTNNGGWIKSDRPVVRWSPDSKHIATFRQDSREVGYMYLVKTRIGHPKLKKWKYTMPGDSAIFRIDRVIINLKPHQRPQVVHLKMKPDAQRSTINDFISVWHTGKFLDTQWSPDDNKLAFVSVNRGMTKETLRIADAKTGDVRTVMHENVKDFLQPGPTVRWRVLFSKNEVIWYSQRSNWGHLYLYNLQTGELKHPITNGKWNVLQVRYINPEKRKIYFIGSCRHEGNPYFHYLYSVDFSGKNLKLLTPETANHKVTISKNGKYFVDTYSTPTTPPVSVVRNIQGKRIMTLEKKADISDLKAIGWRPPTPFSVKDRNGNNELYGMMFKPTNFDSTKSYPVLDYVYPGPQTGSVGSWSFRAARLDKQSLAELGFIVVEVNALGTPGRSKAFQDYWYGNMGDLGIADQVAMIKQLANRHSYIDTSRVGIWGHSGGGNATTRAMLAYPNFFKVGVSEAANQDSRDYEANWGDKYQGLLKTYGDSTNYDNQANELLAHNLKGKLLIAKGTMDSNVPPEITYLMIDSLEAANKNFNLIIFPNRNHGFYFDPYMIRRRWDYFVQNLEHAEPPKNFEVKGYPKFK